ncbi:MAG: SMC-Scp complex subunit ScpB, partial [Clostridia bacterium]|nr:SMC-Scp complex subunit ScpB [Clostridia bacterium]
AVPVNPKSILEALLFVGHPRNESLSPGQAAEIMRGVRPDEIAGLVAELNAQYEASGRPYRIVFERGGYRMKLLPEFDSLREGFFGKVRQVRLSAGPGSPGNRGLPSASHCERSQPAARQTERGDPRAACAAEPHLRHLSRRRRPKKHGPISHHAAISGALQTAEPGRFATTWRG